MPYFLSRAMAVLLAGTTLFTPLATTNAFGQAAIIKDMILNDPEAPTGGNPKGDVTIVAFLDYNCPFCKRSSKDLEKVVKEDGNIRLVYKDWPVLAPTSFYGAQLAIASKYQGKYETVHKALMAIPGFGIPQEEMLEAVSKAGVDMKRLNADLLAHANDIDTLVQRNLSIGDALSFAGTPVYLVGPYKTSTLDVDGFKKVIAAARARKAESKSFRTRRNRLSSRRARPPSSARRFRSRGPDRWQKKDKMVISISPPGPRPIGIIGAASYEAVDLSGAVLQ